MVDNANPAHQYDIGEVYLNTSELQTEELSIKGLIDEARLTRERSLGDALILAERNELWCFGDQTRWPSALDMGSMADDEEMPQITRNYVGQLWRAWNARVLEDRPDIWAVPNDASGHDAAAAEVGNKLISYVQDRQDFDDLLHQAAGYVQLHGAVAFRAYWDPTAGPKAPPRVTQDPITGEYVEDGGGEPLGDVVIDVVTIFDYWTDGSEDVADSKYAIFRKYVDLYEARAILNEYGVPREIWEQVKDQPYDSAVGASMRGVEVLEIWHRPTARLPNGLFALVVGDYVAHHEPFPYAHGEVILSVWKAEQKRGSPVGNTHFNDAINIQREINEITSVRVQRVREMGDMTLLICNDEVRKAIEGGNGLLVINDPEMRKDIKYLEPPAPAEILEREIDTAKRELHDVYGLSEPLLGAPSSDAPSGKAIAFLNKLDSMKTAGTTKSLFRALRRLWKQVLSLHQQYVAAPRMVHIVGIDREMQVIEFVGADLQGLDIKVMPSPGEKRNQVANAEQAQAAGNAELGQSGLDRTTGQASAAAAVQNAVAQIVRGQPAQPPEDIDPAVAVRELQQAVSIHQGSQFEPELQRLLAWYRRQMGPTAVGPEMMAEDKPMPSLVREPDTSGPGDIPVGPARR